jgi:hypothetical protein
MVKEFYGFIRGCVGDVSSADLYDRYKAAKIFCKLVRHVTQNSFLIVDGWKPTGTINSIAEVEAFWYRKP